MERIPCLRKTGKYVRYCPLPGEPSRHEKTVPDCQKLQVEERNAKLLQTLSEATDMLAEADEMQAGIPCAVTEEAQWGRVLACSTYSVL